MRTCAPNLTTANNNNPMPRRGSSTGCWSRRSPAWVGADGNGNVTRETLRGANALLLVEATYAMAQLLVNCLAICTANCLCASDAILRRLRARPLVHAGLEFPVYLYQADLRPLQCDSRSPVPAYTELLQTFRRYLAEWSWITSEEGKPERSRWDWRLQAFPLIMMRVAI